VCTSLVAHSHFINTVKEMVTTGIKSLKSCRGELGAPEAAGANKAASVKHPKGNKGCSSMKGTRPTARMKCLCTNAHSMGNKQEQLGATVLLESCDLTAIVPEE